MHGILGSKARGNLGILGIANASGRTNRFGSLGSSGGTPASLAQRSTWPPRTLSYASIAGLGAVCTDAEIREIEARIGEVQRRYDEVRLQEVPALQRELASATSAANTAKEQVWSLQGQLAQLQDLLRSVPSGPDYAGERSNIQSQMAQFTVPLRGFEAAFADAEARAQAADGKLKAKSIELDTLAGEIGELTNRRAGCTSAPAGPGPRVLPAPAPAPSPPAPASSSGLLIGAALGLAALAGLYFMNQE